MVIIRSQVRIPVGTPYFSTQKQTFFFFSKSSLSIAHFRHPKAFAPVKREDVLFLLNVAVYSMLYMAKILTKKKKEKKLIVVPHGRKNDTLVPYCTDPMFGSQPGKTKSHRKGDEN